MNACMFPGKEERKGGVPFTQFKHELSDQNPICTLNYLHLASTLNKCCVHLET